MREIKFRAWDKGKRCGPEYNVKNAYTGESVEWDVPPRMTYLFNPVAHGEYNVFLLSEVSRIFDPEYILMQYTGLKDKNGKEIYEGDIVRFVPRSIEYPDVTFLYEVVWFESSPGFLFKDLSHFDNYDSLEISYQDRLEVIGNIYENPELLEPRT